MEHHCPAVFERKECLVPPREGYKPPIRWPKSRDECWYSALVIGGLYLLEINRILQPGGFWVLSGPPVNYQNRWRGWNTTVQEQKSDYDRLQKLLTSMCFKLYNKKDDIAMWQKTSNSSCYNRLAKPDAYPPKCDDSLELDSAWYTPLHPCVVVPDPKLKNISLKSIPHVAPERMSEIQGGSASAFKHDDSKWKVRAKHYKKVLPALGTDKIRNVMDMNTVYGGFAATLIDDPLWVMNVVLSYSANTLAIKHLCVRYNCVLIYFFEHSNLTFFILT
ncbi:probable methyltransferase PMT21 [Eucalyptus grandis]|uniref:probable methyltransferase PMT21 n=1 Tax=Eucalyptus grandis TaxID=71139 RepID=UPI00192E9DC4|nr:probable methyltransferase PMT21 [Eucalyptus grandis]